MILAALGAVRFWAERRELPRVRLGADITANKSSERGVGAIEAG